MIKLVEVIRGIRERAVAKKAYGQMAQLCPGDFESLGYAFIREESKASKYFEGNKAEYEGFRKAWEKKYNGRLPEFS